LVSIPWLFCSMRGPPCRSWARQCPSLRLPAPRALTRGRSKGATNRGSDVGRGRPPRVTLGSHSRNTATWSRSPEVVILTERASPV
jgi:hypothetical protein